MTVIDDEARKKTLRMWLMLDGRAQETAVNRAREFEDR